LGIFKLAGRGCFFVGDKIIGIFGDGGDDFAAGSFDVKGDLFAGAGEVAGDSN